VAELPFEPCLSSLFDLLANSHGRGIVSFLKLSDFLTGWAVARIRMKTTNHFSECTVGNVEITMKEVSRIMCLPIPAEAPLSDHGVTVNTSFANACLLARSTEANPHKSPNAGQMPESGVYAMSCFQDLGAILRYAYVDCAQLPQAAKRDKSVIS
jgi:hypothetical protein